MSFARELSSKDSGFWLNEELWKLCSSYEEDFKLVIKQRELKRIPFQHQSPQLVFRCELVYYLKEIAVKKNLSHSCLHLAVYLLDIFMDNHSIRSTHLYIVTNVCILLATKFEENKEKILKIAEIKFLMGYENDVRFPLKDYVSTEMLVLKFFHGFVMFPTAAHYIHYYMQAVVSSEDLKQYSGNFRKIVNDINDHIRYYLDEIISDVHYMQLYRPSQLAASILSAARIRLGLKSWTSSLEMHTDYKFEDLQSPIADILKGQLLSCNKCDCNKSK